MSMPNVSSLFEQATIQQPGVVTLPPNLEHVFQPSQPSNQNTHKVPQTYMKYIKMATVYALLFLTPVVGALGINRAISGESEIALNASPIQDALAPLDYQAATQVSSDTSSGSNDLDYELSLANGFLEKAIKTSNASPQQTIEEKDQIIQLLNQALEAANRAIALAPEDYRGYSARGRVYMATAVIKPEMRALADADFAKARELGATDPTVSPSTQDPMELLPTQQAQSGQQAIIAGPEEQVNETLSGEESGNATRGTATLQSGATEVFVPYASVQSDTQLYVNADDNPENLTVYVKNKEEGVGFTIATTSAPSSPLDITWWEIE